METLIFAIFHGNELEKQGFKLIFAFTLESSQYCN